MSLMLFLEVITIILVLVFSVCMVISFYFQQKAQYEHRALVSKATVAKGKYDHD